MSKFTQNYKLLFSKPLPSSRSGAFYNAFPYPTKISPETIAIYIACMTKPRDTILDAFAGSGSAGIAALLCECPTENMIKMANQFGVSPVWGRRNTVLYEIGTYASFAIKTITSRLKSAEYVEAVQDFIGKGEKLIGELYSAKTPDGRPGIIRHAIWTEVLICPECGTEINYFQNGASRNPVFFKEVIICPHCDNSSQVGNMRFATEDYYDKLIGKAISRKKRKLAWIYGTTDGVNWDREATKEDVNILQKIEDEYIPTDVAREIEWGDLYRAGYHYGITHLHHFYTIRNYVVLSKLWRLAETYSEHKADALKLLLLSYNSTHCTLMTRVVAKHNAKDFVLTGAQSGVLYISKLPVEKNILLGLKRKSKHFEDVFNMLEDCQGDVDVRNVSSTNMLEHDGSIDFVFTDPPFGNFIPYAEVNQINELWLSNVTERSKEVIISNSQNKSIDSYRDMLADVFCEIQRVTKADRPIVVVFHAAKASVWGAFSDAIDMAGLKICQSSFLDKTQASFKQVVSKSAVQGDPLFLLKKTGDANSRLISDDDILKQVITRNPHKTEIEWRHCYSLYIGKCMENGVSIRKDATQVYDYIQRLLKGE